MAVPQTAPFPTPPPTRTQEQEPFNVSMEGYFGHFEEFNDGNNEIATFVNAKAIETNEAANVALAAISSTNFKGQWSALTGSIPDPATQATIVIHNDLYYQAINAIADVTASEPGVSADWALNAQQAARIPVGASSTISVGGRYYITDSTTIDLIDPAGLNDGIVFNISCPVDEIPTVFVGTNKVKHKNGLTDGIIFNGAKNIEFIVRNGLYEV